MKKKILVIETNKILKKIFKKKLYKYTLIYKNFTSQREFKNYLRLNDFYAIYCTFGLNINEEVLKNLKNLKYIISPTTGLDHIDIKYCKKENIKIISLKNKKKFLKDISATAELTWALILALAKNLINYSSDVLHKNKWNRNEYTNFDLKNSTIGIIGYGRIGKIIESYAKTFGMKVFIYEKFKKKKMYKKFYSLKKVLSCKFVTIHIPLENNLNFFTSKNLKGLQKNSFLINTSRGDLFEKKNFIKFLKSKKYSGIGLDVLPSDVIWKNRLPKSFNFIKNLKKSIIVTPHIGGNTLETRIKTTEFIINCFLKT